jgi:hypothetical protein
MSDAPCEWPIIWPQDLDATDEEKALWGPVAAQIIWALSGRRYGRCRRWVRPLTTSGAGCAPQLVHGRWYNGPGRATLVQLPRPTIAVHEVVLGSETGRVSMPTLNYTLYGDSLIRRDGQGWPAQDPEAAEGAPGWWAVDVTTGYPVPLGGQAAAGLYAAELIRARRGSGKCRLPARTASVAREGVDVTLLDPAALYENGLVGLPEVDGWIKAVNPAGLRERPGVTSPDHPLRSVRSIR